MRDERFIALPASLVVMIVGIVANGIVLTALWGWFIMPIFGLPVLTVTQAIGFSMVVGFLTYQHIESETAPSKSFAEVMVKNLAIAVGRPGMTLLFGWFVQLFM